MDFLRAIDAFEPQTPQETCDKALILQMAEAFPDTILTRACRAFHLTSSGFVFNRDFTRCLMVYHNLYDSWSYTGGHADGEADLLSVARREAQEETGITGLVPLSEDIVSLDILPVFGHFKRGEYVSAHLHFSAVYAFVGDDKLPLRIKADENSQVGWLSVDRLADYCTEAHMLPVYEKIIERSRAFHL